MKKFSVLVLLSSGLLSVAHADSPLLLEPEVPAPAVLSRVAAPRTADHPATMRTRVTHLNPSALPGPDAPHGMRTKLNVFADAAPEAEWQEADHHAPDNYAWHGQVTDDPMSATTLTVVGDATVLEVISPKHGQYLIRSLSDGSSEVSQLDPETLKGDGNDFVLEGAKVAGFGTNAVADTKGVFLDPATPAAASPNFTASTIDVLMVYTTKAMQKAGGRPQIVAMCQSAVNGENGAYHHSAIVHSVRLVQTYETGHTSSGNLPTELGWVAGNSDVAAQRNTAGADVVAFLSETDNAGTGGIAQQLGSTGGNSGTAFSAVYYAYIGGIWPHEVGHNLGCMHNSPGVYSYASGHYWTDSVKGIQYGTIMSYVGSRIPYFSNPDVNFYNGYATGTSSQNNALCVNNTGDNLAGYRAAKTLINPSCAITTSTSHPAEGANFTLTVTTKNTGPSTASGCKFTVTLPGQLTLVSNNAGVAFNTSTKVWSLPDLSAGATANLQLTVRANAGTAGISASSSATISSVGSGNVDFDLYNNDSSVAVIPATATTVTTSGLILHYALDETSGQIAGDAATLQGGVQNAIATNAAPQWLPTNGVIGGALRFTPTAQTDVSQAFSYNSAAAIISGYPFTMALWVRATPGTWYQVCAMLGDPTVGSSYFELSLNNQHAQLMARNTAQVLAISPGTITDGNWHHLAGVCTSATQRTLYVDGVPVATNTTSVNFVSNNNRFSIGALMRNAPNQSFPGDLDDIGLWSYALTPENIALIHALGRYSAVALDDPAISTLFTVYTNNTGSFLTGGVNWVPTSGLSGPVGSAGLINGQPYVVLNANGKGLAALTATLTRLDQPDGSYFLMWPSGFSNWILQESGDGTNWSNSTLPVADNGVMQIVYISGLDADGNPVQQYFRLVDPNNPPPDNGGGVPDAPALTVFGQTTDSFFLSWSAAYLDWTLQESSDLVNWSDSVRPVSTTESAQIVSVSTLDAGQVYFRLVAPAP